MATPIMATRTGPALGLAISEILDDDLSNQVGDLDSCIQLFPRNLVQAAARGLVKLGYAHAAGVELGRDVAHLAIVTRDEVARP